MEKVLSAESHGSNRTSIYGDFVSKSSVLISDERLEEMSDEALQAYYERLQMSVKITSLENVMLERFSERVDPSIMVYINHTLNHNAAQAHNSPVSSSHMSIFGRRSSIDSITSTRTIGTIRPRLTGSTMTRAADRISKLTLQQKMDIIIRELELAATSMEKTKENWKIAHARLVSEIEEAKLRIEIVRKAKEELEEGFSHEWLDPVTGHVPAEKFLRFIKEQIHLAEGNVQRYRLRTSTLLIRYNRAKQQLHYKEELQEGLSTVDFEQNKIINAKLGNSLGKKNQYFLELKQIAGKCNLDLNEKKKNLWKVIHDLNELKKCIMEKENDIEKFNSEADLINDGIQQAVDKLNKLKKIISEYEAPSVLEYIKKKAELDDLLRQKRSWSKRKTIMYPSYSLTKGL